MSTQIFNVVISALGIIAWTYFLFDRRSTVGRLNKHSSEIDKLKTESIETRSGLAANLEADKLRVQMLSKTLDHLEETLRELKQDFKQQQQDTKDLQKLIYEYLLKGQLK